jgi:hypothetical protein
MELASMLAEEPFSDRAGAVSPVIGAFLRTYNDGLDDERRQDLYPVAALIVGSRARRHVEDQRAIHCLAFARRHGARLSHGRAALGWRTPEAAGSAAALAALHTERHEEALAFVEELVAMRPRRRRELGPDPADTIERALERVWPTAVER